MIDWGERELPCVEVGGGRRWVTVRQLRYTPVDPLLYA